MRVALISDLHGNEVALSAVLRDAERARADLVACLGDVATLGPSPCEVLAALRALGCPCILGNHDAFMLDPNLVHEYAEVEVVTEAVEWCRARLGEADLEFIASFRETLELPLDGATKLLLFHGTPRSHMEDLLATTPPDELDRMLDGHAAPVMAGGHTHIQMLRQHRGMLLVNPGSVGLPFREYVFNREPTLLPHAEYAIVDASGDGVGVELRRVPLDRDALRRVVEASDNPLRSTLLQQCG